MTQLSRPRGFTTWAAYAGWAVFLLDLVLVLFLEIYQFPSQAIIWAIVTVVWLLGSLSIVAASLPLLYHQYLSSRRTWLILLSLWVISLLVREGVILRQLTRLQTLSMLVLAFDSLAIAVSLCVLLVKHDLGVKLIGWLSITWMWSVVFIVSRQSSLVNVLAQFMQSGHSPFIWWYGVLSSLLCCLVPLGFLSFACHSLALLWREINHTSHSLNQQ